MQPLKRILLLLALLALPILGNAQATNLVTLKWEYNPALTNEVGGFFIYSADVLPSTNNAFPSGWTQFTNIVGIDPTGTNNLPLLVIRSQKFYTATAYAPTNNFWGGPPVESVPSAVVSTPAPAVAPTLPPQKLGIRKGP